jgi:hypothetical protein
MEGSGMTTFPAAGIVQDEVRFQPYSKESPGYDGWTSTRKQLATLSL